MLTNEDLEAFGYYEKLEETQKTPMQMVREYKKTAKQNPTKMMSLDLIFEEYGEWNTSRTPLEEIKELADLLYVIYGYGDTMGWNLDEALRRVHENNLGRIYQEDGTIKYREDGKVVKNKSYPKVNLKDLV